ncbi:MAG: TonB-dependent receptor [Gemmatimonadaceae bacterium]|nr:TonB-dependent receptor [Gemmatimonadaceae bacterium]
MRGACALLTIGCATAVAAQPIVVRGTTRDAALDRPLPFVTVVARAGATDSALTRSDSAGHFVLRLRDAADSVRLEARYPGYARERRTLSRAMLSGTREWALALRPAPLALDALVITAARREQKLGDAVQPTELVSRRDIEQTGASDVASVLTEQTGIQLGGGLPAGAGAQLQGLGEQRVLVLLDGQPLVGRSNGTFDLSRLPTANLERVEVVKGPQATLYGSDAMGGVINLVTRRPTGARMEGLFQATGGTQGRRDVHGQLAGTWHGADATVDLGHRAIELTPGFAASRGTLAERLDVAPRFRWRGDSTWTAEMSGFLVQERQRYLTGQIYRFTDRDQVAARAAVTHQRGTRRMAATLYTSRFDNLSRASLTDRPVAGGRRERDRQALDEVELMLNDRWKGAAVDAGLEVRRETIRADRVSGFSRGFDAVEPFAQVSLTRGIFTVVPGARVTWHEQWGVFAAPRIAVLARPVAPLAIRASVGRGFRGPDFKEQFLDFVNPAAGYAVQGNPLLRPERSASASLNVEWADDRWFVRGGGFYNDLHDFIEFSTAANAGSGVFSYANTARGATRGTEWDAAFNVGRVRLEGGYAFVDARNKVTGAPLLGRPRHSGRASVSMPGIAGVRLSATALYTGERPISRDVLGAVVETQPAFRRLDLRAARALRNGLDASLGIDNALDERMGDGWPGFTGRQVYAGFTWRGARR